MLDNNATSLNWSVNRTPDMIVGSQNKLVRHESYSAPIERYYGRFPTHDDKHAINSPKVGVDIRRNVSITSLALEEAVGNSLAFAINSLDLNGQCLPQHMPLGKREERGQEFLPNLAFESTEDASSRYFYHRAPYTLQHQRSLPSTFPHDQHYKSFQPNSAPPNLYYARRTHSVDKMKAPNVKDGCLYEMTPSLTETRSERNIELIPFLLDRESNSLVIWNIERISDEVLYAACEAHGNVHYFQTEFMSFGIAFVTYEDVRSAIQARLGLSRELHCFGAFSAEAQFSIPLYASGPYLKEVIVFNDLPGHISEVDITRFCRNFGDIRSIHLSPVGSLESPSKMMIILNYFSIDSAQFALKEITTNPPVSWGAHFVVEPARRSEEERALGLKLIAVLERWRIHLNMREYSKPSSSYVWNPLESRTASSDGEGSLTSANTTPDGIMSANKESIYGSCLEDSSDISMQIIQNLTSKSSVWRDGYGSSNSISFVPNEVSSSFANFSQMSEIKGRPKNTFGVEQRRRETRAVNSVSVSSVGSPEDEFSLDIGRIAKGLDKRTTIMIRNIPNKYTQIMLLQEVDANFQQAYDFFYLPIDFKNGATSGTLSSISSISTELSRSRGNSMGNDGAISTLRRFVQ
eukprot:CAMPEP_0171453174 /NCGR_PEP_ID=MMETSP0945-20130129/988_1 /TAXON_ID=109269 /ORGANISM="Vaucheria litorea, Strain CCMP2940" /LENGTH=633 /DNA_ID=CAMNT_0011977989 /DNA_START=147 /DNA_END=2049 /DNA_ORIENTATION=+